jgi:hypothetical protein
LLGALPLHTVNLGVTAAVGAFAGADSAGAAAAAAVVVEAGQPAYMLLRTSFCEYDRKINVHAKYPSDVSLYNQPGSKFSQS